LKMTKQSKQTKGDKITKTVEKKSQGGTAVDGAPKFALPTKKGQRPKQEHIL